MSARLRNVSTEILPKIVGYAAIPIANFSFVLSLKTTDVEYVLTVYTLSSALISLLIILLFSNLFISRDFFSVLSFAPFVLLGSYFVDENLFYLCCVIIATIQQGLFDFFTTQFNISKYNLARIIFCVFSVGALLLSNSIFNFLCIRQLLFLVYLVKLRPSSCSEKLSLKNAKLYIFGTHLIYYGHLSLVSFMVADGNVKFLFIATQIFHQSILRFSDFSIRSSYGLIVSPGFFINCFLLIILACLPVALYLVQLELIIFLLSTTIVLFSYRKIFDKSIIK